MKKIYLAVAERLQQEVPELVFIDMEAGQIDAYDRPGAFVEYPCALIDISFPRCEDQDSSTQQCEVDIVVRLVFEAWMDETALSTPRPWAMRALDKLDIVDKVSRALQGWSTAFLSDLSRASVRPEKRADGLKVIAIPFKSTFEDDMAP